MARHSRVLFLSVLLVGACFQRVSPIRTTETADGAVFELVALAQGAARERKHELLDLTVTKHDCSSSSAECTMWSIERAGEPGKALLTGTRISYGKLVAGTVIKTPARSLVPARYAVSATVQEYGSQGELVRSISMEGDFAISTAQRAANRDESNETGGE